MNNFYPDQVALCHKENCVHARGENAQIIVMGVFIFLVALGIGAIAKALS